MLEGTKAKKLYYSLKSFSDYRCKVIENQFEGMLLKINNVDVWVKLIGEFNAYNILSVYSVANQFGFEDSDVFIALSMLNPVEGRFDVVKNDSGITGVVDYAHTDDALKNAEDRGQFFIKPGTKVYKGMIIGENNRPQDLEINICKTKQLTKLATLQHLTKTSLNRTRV